MAQWVPKKVKIENFLYILRSNGPLPAGARQYYTNSGAPGCVHKISRDIQPMLPAFFTMGGKYPKFWPKLRPKSSSDRRIFEVPHFIGNQKQTWQGPTIVLSPYQTWDGSATRTRRTVGTNGYPKRVKVENFLYILRSSGPRRAQRRQCYTTCWGRSCFKKAKVPYLPIRTLHFTGGKNQQPPLG